ncbi:hypothetical protein [Ruegeria atlantica]|uniref:hypothetical protein n=1 Tax=Ruegeria atlantica TaxID=81569 RepID=UPI00147F5DE1|nr:hypothetical protein [Ruegeria atlantica]
MQIDHKKLDVLLGKILDAHASGEVSMMAATGAIAHVIAAVEKGNESEVEKWINDPDVFERWVKLAGE